MMRQFMPRLLVTLLWLLVVTSDSQLAGWLPLVKPGPPVGPGDVVSGATAFWGLRGYNGAFATGANAAINIRRASDNATTDVVINTNGALDIASANAFAGTAATCNASISGTTLTLQAGACSGGVLHINDTITGAGITQPAFISVIGTCGGNTNGATCTVNSTQSVGTETITAQVAMFVTKMYDQTGNGHTASQTTASQQVHLLPTCINALPCMDFVGTNYYPLTFGSDVPQPLTISTVVQRNAAFTSYAEIFRADGGGNTLILRFDTTANNILQYAGGSLIVVAATDLVTHAIQAVYNGASSAINVDGTDTTSINPGTQLLSSITPCIGGGQASCASTALDGYLSELGIWPSAFSSGDRASVRNNQRLYWGTP